MKKVILILVASLLWCNLVLADQKPGRFFEDQSDVTEDHQIHFNYLLVADSEDREMDINGKGIIKLKFINKSKNIFI